MSEAASPLSPAHRRRALAWGQVNAGLWAAGNSLTTGSLVSYLARDLGAQGLGLSLMLAMPNLAGVLRLAAPALIYQAGTARRACLSLSLASYLLIVGLPAIAVLAPGVSRTSAVSLMIALLLVHQLLEYLGMVALWAWWADLVPAPIRGRYFARRQMIQLAVSVPTLLASGYFADRWRDEYKADPEHLLLAYAIPTGLGALLLLASLAPLAMMPATRRYPRPAAGVLGTSLLLPFLDRRFRRLLLFRGWFSLANGISQTVQNVIYPKEVLGLGVAPMSTMRVSMQLGQLAASQPAGRASDRFGNRPVLVAAQICVSAALVFYVAATPQTRWLLLGAWLLFAAYVAHNICLPNLVLKLAPAGDVPAYVAANDAIGSLLHAAATIGGGMAFDWLRSHSPDTSIEPYRSCLIILVTGLVLRSIAVLLVARSRNRAPGRGARSCTAGASSKQYINFKGTCTDHGPDIL
jgi:MFS family permease